jgi:maltose-binding protein MalE
MKKRIVINVNKDYYCIGCTDTTCSESLYDFLRCCIEDKEYTKEKVPETFEDVKQLTKELIEKLKLNKDVWEIDIQKDFIDIQKKYVTYRVRFTSIGNILFDAYLKIAENKTPNEIWSFIKSLIGEE